MFEAVVRGHEAIASLLLEAGADVQHTSDGGTGVLQAAIASPSPEAAMIRLVQDLVSRGANINHTNTVAPQRTRTTRREHEDGRVEG